MHSRSCTFDIIALPSHHNTINKSPLVHEQHHLGLESWCVQHVYEYAHNTILAGRRPAGQRSQRLQSPTKPAALSTDQLLKYLNSATLINPDVATYWNMRRKLFSRNRLSIQREFQFSAIVLSRKPKSNEAFFYRRWLFSFQSECDFNNVMTVFELNELNANDHVPVRQAANPSTGPSSCR